MEFSDVTCRVECLGSVGETYIGTLLIENEFVNITDAHDETKNFGVPTAAFYLEPHSIRNKRALFLQPVETIFGPEDAEIKQVSFRHEDPDTMRTMQVVFEECHLGERSATPPALMRKVEPMTPYSHQGAFDIDHDFGPAGPTLGEVAMQSQPAQGGRRIVPSTATQAVSQDPNLLNIRKFRGNVRGRGIPPRLTDQIPQRLNGEKPRPPHTTDEVKEGYARFLDAPPPAPTVNVAKTSRTTPHKTKRQRVKEELGATEILPQSAAQLGQSLADVLNILVETKTVSIGVQTDPLELCSCTETMMRSKQ